MYDGKLNVETDSLTNVGNALSDVASEVRDNFTKMQNVINQVTANDSWNSEASRTFLEKFENIKPELEHDLRRLEELGPTINDIANGYSNAENENIGNMKRNEDFENM